jgi:hypothetical protein
LQARTTPQQPSSKISSTPPVDDKPASLDAGPAPAARR